MSLEYQTRSGAWLNQRTAEISTIQFLNIRGARWRHDRRIVIYYLSAAFLLASLVQSLAVNL